jgi:hypothetical protein
MLAGAHGPGSHPCQAVQRVGARQNVVAGRPGLRLTVGLTTQSRENVLLRNNGGGKDPHKISSASKEEIG